MNMSLLDKDDDYKVYGNEKCLFIHKRQKYKS